MTKSFLFMVILWLNLPQVSAQCTLIDVAIPDQVCLQSNFLVENNATAAAFEWDLCPFDLRATPAVLKVMNTGLSSTIDFTLAEDNNMFYGFAVDANANSLLRLDFGNSRENIPTKVNLGNVNDLFQFPNSISVVRENGIWLAVVANGGNDKIILLNFGNLLSNLPTASVIHTRGGGGFANIAVASTSEAGRTLIIAEFNTQQISVVNYPQGFLMPSDTQQTISIPGSTPIDVQLIRQCDDWKGLVLSFDNRKLYNLDFGNSFVDPPVVSEYGISLAFEPYRLSLVREGEAFYGFVSGTSGGLNRLDFDNDIDINPTVTSLGSFGVLSNSRSLIIDSSEGQWRGFMINFSDGDLYRFSFQKNCGVSPAYFAGHTPGYIQYTVAGDQDIAVTSFEADGTVSASSHQVTVTNQIAPDFTIRQTNSCVNHEVYFQPENVQGVISDYQWAFGDGNTSSIESPSYVYSSTNTYPVTLLVSGENSCSNQKQIDVTIFEKPVSQFLLPAATPACTNQILEFTNTSDFDEDSQPYWRWFVNAVEVSGDRDLNYALSTAGPHNIKLVAGISGCDSESEKNIGPLTEGPKVEFEYTGICLGEGTGFINMSSGEIEEFEWDFGDGKTSADPNPTNMFSDFGQYEVALTAISAIGCRSRKTEIIHVRSNPVFDFQISDPPCSGMPTQFYNYTTSPDGGVISGWLWNFNDENEPATKSEKNPEHVFVNAGIYHVSLLASTEFGCEATGVKEITIRQSPSTDFAFSPACEEVPVTFTNPVVDGIDSWYWEIGTAYYTTASPSHLFRTPGDFPVYLKVTGSNGCNGSSTEIIHVPVPLTPDFSVLKNCVDQEAVFTDITFGPDPIVSREWNFNDGEVFTTSPVTYAFRNPGNTTVGLEVTTQSGCSYQVSIQVEILSAPQAAFSADPVAGGYPLEVAFMNSSSYATQYVWRFSDGTGATSTEVSPVYTFQEPGSHRVELTAYNEQQCEDTSEAIISTVAPLPDAAVEMIFLSPNPDGSSRLIVTIHNKGNTYLKDLLVDIDFGGGLSLRQIVGRSIFPGTKHNLVLSTGILNPESMRYLCVSIDLPDDVDEEGNRICTEFENVLYVFPVFPNPAIEVLTVDWIARAVGTVRISLTDAIGRTVFGVESSASKGLNHRTMDLSGLQVGLYYLLVEDGTAKNRQRILVSAKP